MMWWGDAGWGWGGWLTMTLVMVAFWGLVAWVVVTLVRQTGTRHERSPDADKILDERFARGEIDEEEYATRRAVIHSHR